MVGMIGDDDVGPVWIPTTMMIVMMMATVM